MESTYNCALRGRERQSAAGILRSRPNAPASTSFAKTNYLPVLAPYDLTRGGGFYKYFGHTDVKELALYIEDEIKAGNWDFNLGLREDLYNGLTDANQTEPRVGIAYNIKPSGTVLASPMRARWKRRSTKTWCSPAAAARMRCWRRCSLAAPAYREPSTPAIATSSMPVCSRPSASMPWSAASTSGSTRTTPSTSACSATPPSSSPSTGTTPRFPAMRCTSRCPMFHNFSAYFVMSSVAARFFPPQSAGAGAAPQTGSPFRIDHDEKFNQTTHLQYHIVSQGWPMASGAA